MFQKTDPEKSYLNNGTFDTKCRALWGLPDTCEHIFLKGSSQGLDQTYGCSTFTLTKRGWSDTEYGLKFNYYDHVSHKTLFISIF